ncbi:hypothetical protein Y032_0021g370 [Ancylostoma ceylanicum]|uniref:Uncharacterized protein n=1 Tax=Ancylostoma ceylanicum TaxID=53326 RepID=A0A016UZT8_9BILA|nr:hypothetical protein Y032_0021g370 [Ancylostoma ceylanicum]
MTDNGFDEELLLERRHLIGSLEAVVLPSEGTWWMLINILHIYRFSNVASPSVIMCCHMSLCSYGPFDEAEGMLMWVFAMLNA